MDYSLASEERREKFYKEKAGYSQSNGEGSLVINKDLDIALLMTYGHILTSGSSFVYALNYFFRAYALDPENPMINLSLALAYIQHGLKRQAENRQHAIIQGLTFMHHYYDSRKEAEHFEERQEAHYNLGRTYHLVGLVHLAIPYYRKVLNASEGTNRSPGREDLVVDAAYNLQTIYAMAGNTELADSITKKWLVI
jgi:general transcription factor 3C polypeptide 3 (transcription factor C subunit 4)